MRSKQLRSKIHTHFEVLEAKEGIHSSPREREALSTVNRPREALVSFAAVKDGSTLDPRKEGVSSRKKNKKQNLEN